MDPESGALVKDGNIYDEPEFADLVKDKPVVSKPGEQENHIIESWFLKQLTEEPKDETTKRAFAQAQFSAHFVVGRRPAAFLYSHKPEVRSIHPDVDPEAIVAHPKLQGKLLVRDVEMCDAYLFYLSYKGTDAAAIALRFDDVTDGEFPPVWTDNTDKTGYVKYDGFGAARPAEGSKPFAVFCTLKHCQMKPPFGLRDSPPPPDFGLDKLMWVEPNWQILNSDGEEDPPLDSPVLMDTDSEEEDKYED
ncbi:hypothetical protein FRB99_003401 [Tulasnella sp. 403]|nr:hypothetical protein FRB99_003401 [Tulasnella sp. 403]